MQLAEGREKPGARCLWETHFAFSMSSLWLRPEAAICISDREYPQYGAILVSDVIFHPHGLFNNMVVI